MRTLNELIEKRPEFGELPVAVPDRTGKYCYLGESLEVYSHREWEDTGFSEEVLVFRPKNVPY